MKPFFPHNTTSPIKIVVARDTNATAKFNFNTYYTHTLSLSIMSGQSNKSSSSSNTNSGNSNTQSSSPPEPTVIQGWQHSPYANRDNDRYAYIGKDDDTREPMWMDYGPKGKK